MQPIVATGPRRCPYVSARYERESPAMPEILHRISIDAPASTVHDLVATTDGVGRWWTGRPVEGDAAVGGQFSAFFGDTDTPAAVFQTESDGPDEVVWRVIA